jgi:hypothetical protein
LPIHWRGAKEFVVSSSRIAFLAILFMVLLFSALSQVPTSEKPDQAGAVQSGIALRAHTRLVVVDVVATDNKDRPVPDLNIDDFTMLEEGKPQKISHFSFQHPGAAPPATPPLPPDVVKRAAVQRQQPERHAARHAERGLCRTSLYQGRVGQVSGHCED